MNKKMINVQRDECYILHIRKVVDVFSVMTVRYTAVHVLDAQGTQHRVAHLKASYLALGYAKQG